MDIVRVIGNFVTRATVETKKEGYTTDRISQSTNVIGRTIMLTADFSLKKPVKGAALASACNFFATRAACYEPLTYLCRIISFDLSSRAAKCILLEAFIFQKT